ncbi:MAG: FAD-dependent oxidoreductase [Bacilli bacterium]|nr:FAD-dependent oxidoreductase [Mycoplasmatota bacterium]MDD6942274.1 FAD-dependent oxidoreductase [bacterium]MDY2697573.1 FAD-dependent oxidoreductase [Bacilli bacterium]MEE0014939.1 FAD-dependent oxidoreductase [Bacilli bacterium]
MKYDVVIVGAGPAGLFNAYELITNNPKLKIAILEKGFFVKKRVCPMIKQGVPCKNCNPCAILSGYGGAGTFSDGKLNFIPKLGKSDLTKYMSESEAYKLIDETETIFNKFNMNAEVYPSNLDFASEIRKKVTVAGAKLLIIKQKHLGSDHLPEYIEGICKFLADKGVSLIERSDVIDIKTINEEEHEITYLDPSKKEKSIISKNVVIAPGRTGAKWIQDFADKHNIPYLSQSIEIGVRVEVRKDIMEEITNVIYDPTIFIKTKTYSDEIRTFCTNPGGFVAKENYYGYICVNGHALKDTKSNNTNFAFISKINLTEPVTNTRLYGESIAKIANVLGDGKPIIQSLKDLKNGRRSEWHRINKGFIEPTLKDCVAGDLALVMPHRIITNILEGLETLDKIIPGVANDDTLLYGPEIKFFSNEIATDSNFKLNNDNIYFIGDGAGKAGNIVTAAATGLVAARDILERTKKNAK